MILAGGSVEKIFNKYTANSKKVNSEVLFKILNRSKNCSMGKKYNFNDIKSIEEFKQKVEQ